MREGKNRRPNKVIKASSTSASQGNVEAEVEVEVYRKPYHLARHAYIQEPLSHQNRNLSTDV